MNFNCSISYSGGLSVTDNDKNSILPYIFYLWSIKDVKLLTWIDHGVWQSAQIFMMVLLLVKTQILEDFSVVVL